MNFSLARLNMVPSNFMSSLSPMDWHQCLWTIKRLSWVLSSFLTHDTSTFASKNLTSTIFTYNALASLEILASSWILRVKCLCVWYDLYLTTSEIMTQGTSLYQIPSWGEVVDPEIQRKTSSLYLLLWEQFFGFLFSRHHLLLECSLQ